MSTRRYDPVITDRGDQVHPSGRFACKSRRSSRTSYAGATARKAYLWWVKSTRAGRRHAAAYGYDKRYIVKGEP